MTRKARRSAARVEIVPTADVALRLLSAGDAAGAASAARAALALRPGDSTALQVLGVVAYGAGETEAALGHFRQAVETDPRSSDGYYNLAECLKRLGRFDGAAEAYRKTVALRPEREDAWINLSFAHLELGQYGEAIAAADSALAVRPDSAQILLNLSLAQWASGYVGEGVATIRRAVELEPSNVLAWSNLLMYLQYSAEHSSEELFEAAQAWGRTMDRLRVGPVVDAMPEPARLRVGYVSGDLCDHPVGHQIEKILAGHDPARVEVFLYATSEIEDAVTSRLRSHAAGFRCLALLDDEAAARRIAEDGVHVLIDLSGHTARHRLGVLAHRPAPLQASWLGYFATTGLPQMDYVLRDPAQIPPEEARFYSERVWTLEDAAFGYQPHPLCPELTGLPALANGHVTFGCFANPAKISEAAVAAWARVLHEVPGSRMVLDRKGLDEPLGRDRVVGLFARHGIGPERLDLGASQGHLAYMARYAEVDVVLDTFPCNGATTTYEALWMGVPVVSRRWDRMVGHFAESILGPCGHSDWVARDENGYVGTAVALAGDLDRLSALRASLRSELAASPLCRADDCARCLERAYEGMWREARGPAEDAYDTVARLAGEGRFTEAFAAFERGAALDPGLVATRGPGLYDRLGEAFVAHSRFAEAVVCFTQSLGLRDGGLSAEVLQARAFQAVGASLRRVGREDEAAVWLARRLPER